MVGARTFVKLTVLASLGLLLACGSAPECGPKATPVPSDQNAFQYEYDPKDNLTSLTSPSGDTIRYEYDPLDRLIGVCYPDGREVTYTYDERTLYWPTSPTKFELTQIAHGQNEKGWFYSANSFCTPEHGGTHLDAPIHFHAKGRSVDALPLEQLVAPGIVIDVSAQAAINRDYENKIERIQSMDIDDRARRRLLEAAATRRRRALDSLNKDHPYEAA